MRVSKIILSLKGIRFPTVSTFAKRGGRRLKDVRRSTSKSVQGSIWDAGKKTLQLALDWSKSPTPFELNEVLWYSSGAFPGTPVSLRGCFTPVTWGS